MLGLVECDAYALELVELVRLGLVELVRLGLVERDDIFSRSDVGLGRSTAGATRNAHHHPKGQGTRPIGWARM
eukprot:351841-Chlamydomonas_euryale.AAC.10